MTRYDEKMSVDDNLDNESAPEGASSPGSHAKRPDRARRESGARHETSEPVVFTRGSQRVEGWALNISTGGLRVVLDEPVRQGDEFLVKVGTADVGRPGKVVWVREEKGGAIVGVSFSDD